MWRGRVRLLALRSVGVGAHSASVTALWPHCGHSRGLTAPLQARQVGFSTVPCAMQSSFRRHLSTGVSTTPAATQEQAREHFVRTYLHLLAQEAFFFEDETWEVLGVQHVPNTNCLHVEAIPEDAEYIGIPAFKFVFSFDPELAASVRASSAAPDIAEPEVAQRLRELEKASGLHVTCLGTYAYSPDEDKFSLLAPGVGPEDLSVEEDFPPTFYRPASKQ